MANHVLMKKCNNCGAEIPRSAAYCDICGARDFIVPEVKTTEERQNQARRKSERKYKGKRIAKRVFSTIAIGFAILFTISIIAGIITTHRYERQDRMRDLSGWDTVITKDAFEKIDVGMSYDEMEEIIGGPGKIIENDKYKIRYAWPGEYYVDQYHGLVIVDFYKYDYDEKKKTIPASSIREMDILSGEETFETYKLYKERKFSEIDTPKVSKEQVEKLHEGLNYEQVSEILGEGKLYETDSWISDYDSMSHKSYIWRCKHKNIDSDFYFYLRFDDGILKYYSDWMVENVE